MFNVLTSYVSYFYQDAYSTYLNADLSNTDVGLGFALSFIIYIFLFYHMRKINTHWQIITFNIVALSFLIFNLSINISLISRINFYFTPFLMIGYPIAFDNIKNKIIRNLFIFAVLFVNLYQYFYFFYSETWSEDFYNYKTILSI